MVTGTGTLLCRNMSGHGLDLKKAHQAHGDSSVDKSKGFWHVFIKLLIRLRYLGLAGYALEWILEACHTNKRLHHMLHRLLTPKVHLLAITMVLAGHIAEHLHHEEEVHEQEEHIAHLRAEIQMISKHK